MMHRRLLAVVLLAIPFFATFSFAGEDEDDAGMFEARCGVCHQLPDPAMLKAEQWEKVLVVMQARIKQSGMMPIAEDEMAQVRRFLSKNARK